MVKFRKGIPTKKSMQELINDSFRGAWLSPNYGCGNGSDCLIFSTEQNKLLSSFTKILVSSGIQFSVNEAKPNYNGFIMIRGK